MKHCCQQTDKRAHLDKTGVDILTAGVRFDIPHTHMAYMLVELNRGLVTTVEFGDLVAPAVIVGTSLCGRDYVGMKWL